MSAENFGVVAYLAARRRAEIGGRIALGAERRHILVMMFVDVARMVVLGLAIGSVLTVGLSDLARRSPYQIESSDATTLGLAANLLAAVGLVAALIPAQGAARVDPVHALRES